MSDQQEFTCARCGKVVPYVWGDGDCEACHRIGKKETEQLRRDYVSVVEDLTSDTNCGRDALREKLAANAHCSWSGWMIYLWAHCILELEPVMDADRHEFVKVLIPMEKYDQWRRQQNTLYENLSEDEKRSGRTEADFILEIIKELL